MSEDDVQDQFLQTFHETDRGESDRLVMVSL